MHTFVSFTVVELFEKVWQTPMVKLAHDIGVSDVAVAKACRKAGIPLPGRGHWAKSEKQRQRKPKPPQIEGKVRFQVLDRDTPPDKTGTGSSSPKTRRTIEAPFQLTEPHALVSQWLKTAEASMLKEGYLAYPPQLRASHPPLETGAAADASPKVLKISPVTAVQRLPVSLPKA
ncbi:hypothetical protein D3C85_1319260 [compost metagenome]